MPSFFERAWDEPRGDAYDAWGTCVYHFEVDDQSYPERQLEVYSSGDVLAYDREHADLAYGGLGDQPLVEDEDEDEDEDEWRPFEITADELEEAWRRAKRRNRGPG